METYDIGILVGMIGSIIGAAGGIYGVNKTFRNASQANQIRVKRANSSFMGWFSFLFIFPVVLIIFDMLPFYFYWVAFGAAFISAGSYTYYIFKLAAMEKKVVTKERFS